MKYILMMNCPRTAYETLGEWPKKDLQAHLAFMRSLNQALRASGELVSAEGLANPLEARIVRAGKDGQPVTDGVFPEAKEFLAGYWIVEVETPEQAYAVAAQASAAARDAARAAARAVAASKAHGGTTHHPTPKESPRASASPTPTPEASPTVEPSPAGTASGMVTPPEEYQKQIDELDEQLKNIDRGRLNDADAQRYDVASGLLTSARKALSKNDYMAANSLTQKAKVVVQSIGH